MLLRRVLTPPLLVSVLCWIRWRAKVSFRSEVEVSDNLWFGANCVVASFCKIKTSAGPMHIGSNVEIATHCFLSSDAGGVWIGDDVMIGPMACIIGNNYRYDRLDQPIRVQPKVSKGIRIGRGVWVGSGVVVLDGAEIGDNAIITPNSVVSGRVPENAIVQGNPAQVIFKRR